MNLTQADLLRNLIFMLLPTRAAEIYDEVWRPMEKLIGFDNLEGLARVDLQRRGIDVAVDDVFRRHQDRLESMQGGEEAVEESPATLRSAPSTTSGSSTPAPRTTPTYGLGCRVCDAGGRRPATRY